ncbi:origin recognition complex subunit 3 isoform X1 [Patella vulgata]|uniref:origin recognition complex subunit 3 isoform X1 n=1 Tax=Patella vulgata TaxID=6465 RepID=UPI00217F391E|nr:origin recognition complex subunit 3 isoform X1 [Patella vulgata]
MDTAESVSKGCFAYKGKKRITKPSDYFPVKDNTGKQRHEVYQEMWECVDTEIQIMQSNLNSNIFEELLSFVENSHTQGTTIRNTSVKEIPTAALITGVNTPDHAVMFSNMVSLMKERVTPLITTLRSKDCPALKNMLTKAISQLTSNPDLGLDDEDDEIIQTVVNKKNLLCNMSTLVNWYKDKYINQKPSSPKKRRSKSGLAEDIDYHPPLVIVLEDMESFSPHILQDFITICSNYIEELPLVLVFGIATSVSAVHRLLPNSASSLLCMDKFQAPPSSDYLTQVINKVLFTSTHPFKLGPKVFHLLLDLFLYHDFSVINFVKGLQFCMLDHYYSNSLAHLCCQETDVTATVKKLHESDLDKLRQIPTFNRYMNECSSEEKTKLIQDSKFTKLRVTELLQQLHDYHKAFFPVLNLLHTLSCKLPKHPLGKQLRELYSICIECTLVESDVYKEACDLLRLLSKEELIGLIREGISLLTEEILPHELDMLPAQLESILTRFNDLDAETEHIPEEDAEEESKDAVALPKKTDLHNLRKTLQELEKKKKRLSPYAKLREESVNELDHIFRKYLKCPTSIPLYELLYYNSVSVIKHHINASPRAAIQRALSCPHHYLQCECCKGDVGSILSTMPDVCIVYKLHLECGQLINLYDWLQAFVTVVTSEDEENETNTKKPDQVLQARFIRAVSELQFLGFVKPTKRKTDHVARLTWGGC